MESYILIVMTKNRISLPLDKPPNMNERSPLIWQRAGGTQECWEGDVASDVITALNMKFSQINEK